jgi:hypothetical protein
MSLCSAYLRAGDRPEFEIEIAKRFNTGTRSMVLYICWVFGCPHTKGNHPLPRLVLIKCIQIRRPHRGACNFAYRRITVGDASWTHQFECYKVTCSSLNWLDLSHDSADCDRYRNCSPLQLSMTTEKVGIIKVEIRP